MRQIFGLIQVIIFFAGVQLSVAQTDGTDATDTTLNAPAPVSDIDRTTAGRISASTDATGTTTASDPVVEDPPRDTDIVIVKETLDTVFIFDKSVFRHVAQDWRNNIDIFRQRGYGISGGLFYGVSALMTSPIRNLTKHHPAFNTESYHFGKYGAEPVFMSGGTGFIGLGDGFRLGGGGVSGQALFECTSDNDFTLSTKVSYGGFLVEKVILHKRFNWVIGAMLGGGNMSVSLLEDEWAEPDNWNDDGEKAVFFLLEPHIGLSYTILYFLHIGMNITVPTFMSIEKFDPRTSDFFSANPGIHVKLLFGNLG